MPVRSYALSLDLGTRTGYAVTEASGKLVCSGTILLASPKELQVQRIDRQDRAFDIRFARLRQFIREINHSYPLTICAFEDINFFTSTSQLQIWTSLRCTIWAFRGNRKIPQIIPVPVGTLKKFACGTGHADKTAMRQALKSKPKGLPPEKISAMDDNEIDAIWLSRIIPTLVPNKKT